jgi:dienelactone hydrolase
MRFEGTIPLMRRLVLSASLGWIACLGAFSSAACSSAGTEGESGAGAASSSGGSAQTGGADSGGTDSGAAGSTTGGVGGSAGGSSGGSAGGDSASGGTGGTTSSSGEVHCDALSISGEPTQSDGATFTYVATDDGIDYSLSGILLAPAGDGPFPAVVISHGKAAAPAGYSGSIAQEMVSWGLVGIAVQYTHAEEDTDLPTGDDGASEANVQRGQKAFELLSCLGYVDMARVAAHGHSMGAFLTGQLVGTHPGEFLVASHTAGGVSPGPNATKADVAAQIVTPYQIHHGDDDDTVRLSQDETLDEILTASSIEHELHVYPGYDHMEITFDETMFQRVHDWYEAHGLF